MEWGEDRPVRLMDRLFGDAGGGGQRLSAPAEGAAVVVLALFIAAELVPWMSVTQQQQGIGPDLPSQTSDVSLDTVGWGITAAYYLGLMMLLAVVGLVQVTRPHTRRALTAAGFGLSAAMLVLLVGAIRRAGEGGQYGPFDQGIEATVGPAPYLAIAGVLLVVAALVISGWRPVMATGHRRPAPADPDEDDDDEEPGPIDLTVTPA
ncbi:hypothetical protein GCM10009557_55200 [Virgisporangium ochraceum]